MINKNVEYAKNTFLLLIGKFATQFTSFLLIPLFTHFLSVEDYGYVDLLQTYISLFYPVLTLRIDSAAFRYLIDCRKNEERQKSIITNIILVLFTVIIFSVILGVFLNIYFDINYIIYILLNIVVLMISNILLQILRGLGKNKEYSIASIISGFSSLIINIILIVIYNFNASSILISSIIANTGCSIYIIYKIKLYKLFDIKKINKKTISEMLKYSLPMIPNHLSWWIVNVSDRTIISCFLGIAYNGIYTISCKFSNILNSIFSIFNMSWQESASIHINDADKEEFFTQMINKLLFLFASLSIIILSIIPLLFNILIGKEYVSSYNYIPILLYANLWNVFISLIGSIFVANKKTNEIAKTTIISAVINLIIHVVLVKYIGLYAACISTLLSYIVMGIYRYIDCKKYVNIKLKMRDITIYTIVFFISSILYFINNHVLNILNFVIATVYSIIINLNSIKNIIKLIKTKKIKQFMEEK